MDIHAADVARVVHRLARPNVYLDELAVAECVRDRSTIDLLDSASRDKADFWLLKDEPFAHERFARRIDVDALGLRLKVSPPEETILMKLRCAADGAAAPAAALSTPPGAPSAGPP